jgi:glycogen(starch) synthase
MKVLIGSPAFPPSLGGLERVVEQLALGLAAAGEEVVVLTRTPSRERDDDRFEVVRNPGAGERLRRHRRCDVFLQANVALKDLWPLLFHRRPWVVWHHGVYPRWGEPAGLRGGAKAWISRRATSQVAVSDFVAREIGDGCGVIENPYREDLFRELPGVGRDRELLFAGRLVSDKGADVLLRALGILAGEGLGPRLTVVGTGPEEPALRALAEDLGLSRQIAFAGRLDGEDLVRTMNEHRILVVPSTLMEPFGVVALEGLACGCEVVSSSGGGLPEAVGSFGRTFPNGDPVALAEALREALGGESRRADRGALQAHLRAHQMPALVEQFRALLAGVVGRR